MAKMYPSFSSYAYTLNNPVRYTDPTGMVVEEGKAVPPDWIKDLDTGKVKWIDATGNEAINQYAASKGDIDYTTGKAKNPENYQNLGDSYFGPTKGNPYDKAQILDQRKTYLNEASAKINEKSGVNVGENGNFNNITNEYLSSIFLGSSFGNNQNKGSDIPGLVWDYGVSPNMDSFLKNTNKISNFAKTALGAATTTVGYLLSSESLGRGSTTSSRHRVDAVNQFKTNTIKVIDMGTILKIGNHKF